MIILLTISLFLSFFFVIVNLFLRSRTKGVLFPFPYRESLNYFFFFLASLTSFFFLVPFYFSRLLKSSFDIRLNWLKDRIHFVDRVFKDKKTNRMFSKGYSKNDPFHFFLFLFPLFYFSFINASY